MSRTFVFVGLLVFGFLGTLAWAASQSQFTFSHPRNKEVKILADRRGARVDLQQLAAVVAKKPVTEEQKSLPKVQAPRVEYDFGFMDPNAVGRHSFEIFNRGDAPLTVELVSTTCNCTVGGVSDNVIQPGESGKVQLQWTTSEKLRIFQQSATIRTNDPLKKNLHFTVSGRIRALLAADEDTLVVPTMVPDEAAEVTTLLYSQHWKSFEITGVNHQLKGLTWKATPVDPAKAPELGATSLVQLTVTVPGDLPFGDFQDELKIECKTLDPPVTEADSEERTPDNSAITTSASETATLTLPLQGKMRRRLAVYGNAIRSSGFIDIGTLKQGETKRVKLHLKVRDCDPALHLNRIELTPSFLQAQVEPHVEKGSSEPVPGLYDLVVTVPADAPVCNYLRDDRMGQLRIVSDHPRIPETSLGVKFLVMQ